MARELCKWCNCRFGTYEFDGWFCCETCLHMYNADLCGRCGKNYGRICWEPGELICSKCCKEELERVKEVYEEVIKHERRLGQLPE